MNKDYVYVFIFWYLFSDTPFLFLYQSFSQKKKSSKKSALCAWMKNAVY